MRCFKYLLFKMTVDIHIHSFIVYSFMAMFFPGNGFGPADTFSDILTPASILSGLIIALIIELFWMISRSQVWKRTERHLFMHQYPRENEQGHSLSLILAILLTLVSALAVTFYFVHRTGVVLNYNGINLSESGYTDILHLQIQFLLGIISLMVLVALFWS